MKTFIREVVELVSFMVFGTLLFLPLFIRHMF